MDALIAVVPIVLIQGPQNPELYARSVPIFLNGADDFDGDAGSCLPVYRFHHFPKGTLTEQPCNFICKVKQSPLPQ